MEVLKKEAAKHRFEHSYMRGHHASVIVYEGNFLFWTLSVNEGKEHAEERALRTFQARAGHWGLKGGHCGSESFGTTQEARGESACAVQAMFSLFRVSSQSRMCRARVVQCGRRGRFEV